MSGDPAGLHLILVEMTALVRRAYSEGYRQGTSKAVDKMTRAAASNMDQRLPSFLRESSDPGMPPTRNNLPPHPPQNHFASEKREAQSFGYGSVIGAFREAILAAPDAGVTKEELFSYCRRLGLDITNNQYRDTMKRLTGGEEVERHHGAYYPGRKLRSDLAKSPDEGFNSYPSKRGPDIFDVNRSDASEAKIAD